MKRPNPLEQERAALLEQIHSSRAAYRRMLAQYGQPEPAPKDLRAPVVERKPQVRGMPTAFPRSQTMRWMVEHPYALAGIAAGIVAMAAIGPRRIGSVAGTAVGKRAPGQPVIERRRHERRRTAPTWGTPQSAPVGRAAFAGAIGLASMLLRDPARMQMVARAANAATEWLRNRRGQRPQSPSAKRPIG